MDKEQLRQYLWHSVSDMEIGSKDPYSLQDAKLGTSGYSFGYLQHDISSGNNIAVSYFKKVIDAEVADKKLTADEAKDIVKGAKAKDLSDDQMAKANQALSNHKDLVAEADQLQLDIVAGYAEDAFKAAESNPNGPGDLNRTAPDSKLLVALGEWGNMTNGLSMTNANYTAVAEHISAEGFQNYLLTQGQFTNPEHKSFKDHWAGRVEHAAEAGLTLAGASVTTAIASKASDYTLNAADINPHGTQYLSLSQNAAGQNVARLWSFSYAVNGSEAGSLKVKRDGHDEETIEPGRLSKITYNSKGEYKAEMSGNIAAPSLSRYSFDQAPTYNIARDPAIAQIRNQLQSSGINAPEQTPQLSNDELMKNLKNSIAQFNDVTNPERPLTAPGAFDNNIPDTSRGAGRI